MSKQGWTIRPSTPFGKPIIGVDLTNQGLAVAQTDVAGEKFEFIRLVGFRDIREPGLGPAQALCIPAIPSRLQNILEIKGAPSAQMRQVGALARSSSFASARSPLRGIRDANRAIPAAQSCTARCPS